MAHLQNLASKSGNSLETINPSIHTQFMLAHLHTHKLRYTHISWTLDWTWSAEYEFECIIVLNILHPCCVLVQAFCKIWMIFSNANSIILIPGEGKVGASQMNTQGQTTWSSCLGSRYWRQLNKHIDSLAKGIPFARFLSQFTRTYWLNNTDFSFVRISLVAADVACVSSLYALRARVSIPPASWWKINQILLTPVKFLPRKVSTSGSKNRSEFVPRLKTLHKRQWLWGRSFWTQNSSGLNLERNSGISQQKWQVLTPLLKVLQTNSTIRSNSASTTK